MILGTNIRRYREAKGMTQLALAEALHVTPQAVSRWETSQVEPSVETLRQLAQIFEITLNELILKSEPIKESETITPVVVVKAPPIEAEVVTIEKSETRKLVGKCSVCQKELFEGDVYSVKYKRMGKRHSKEPTLTCKACLDKAKLRATDALVIKNKKARTNGFIYGGLVAAIILAIGIYFMTKASSENLGPTIGGTILLTYASFAFIFNICARNNFILEWFAEIFSFGFVKMPGIIFSLSFGGIAWLIVVKILFAIIAFLIALGFALLAFAVCLALSIFVFPFALYWSLHKPERYDEI